MNTAVDKWPASARLTAVATADHLPTAPTPLGGTQLPAPLWWVSSQFRAIAGIWPYGRGTIDRPAYTTVEIEPGLPLNRGGCGEIEDRRGMLCRVSRREERSATVQR